MEFGLILECMGTVFVGFFLQKNNNSAIHIDLSVLGQYLHLPSFNEIVLT